MDTIKQYVLYYIIITYIRFIAQNASKNILAPYYLYQNFIK